MPRIRIVPLAVASLFILATTASSDIMPRLRGVRTRDFQKYVGGIRCVAAYAPRDAPAALLPVDRVNDDYCDCADGADEPGTSACPGGQFVCENFGHRELVIDSAWVDDGHCDCCDGTDEPVGACKDECGKAGEAARTEAKNAAARVLAGVKIRDEYVDEGLRIVAANDEKLRNAKREFAELEPKLKAASHRVSQLDMLRDHENRMREMASEAAAAASAATVESPVDSIPGTDSESASDTELISDVNVDPDPETRERDLEARLEVEADLDAAQEAGKSAYDIHGNDLLGAGEESEHAVDGDSGNDSARVQETTPDIDEAHLCAELSSNSSFDLVLKAQYYQSLAMAKLRQYFPRLISPLADPTTGDGVHGTCHSHALNAKQELQSQIDELTAAIRILEQTVGRDYGSPDGAMRKIDGECFEQKFAQYTFKHCPFASVSQFENGHQIASLGTWSNWEAGEAMVYTHGDKCWNGPERSTRVTLECGQKDEIVAVDEPNRCAYLMRFQTPAACTKEQADTLLAGAGIMDIAGEKSEL
jgi:protein kinase C substrate 80K-H